MLDVVVLTYLNLNNSGCDTSYIRSNFKIHATAENPISGIAPSVVQENFALRTDVPFAAQGPGDSGVQVLFGEVLDLAGMTANNKKTFSGRVKIGWRCGARVLRKVSDKLNFHNYLGFQTKNESVLD